MRRGTRYTVSVSSCKVDDPTDGSGVHDRSFCDFNEPCAAAGGSCGIPGLDAPSGSAVTLRLLGIPISVPLGGALVDTTICGLIGANPIGRNPLLDALLGRTGLVNDLLSLVKSGADVALCPSASGPVKYALDRIPGDFARVPATVSWTDRDGRARTLRQSALIANPGGV